MRRCREESVRPSGHATASPPFITEKGAERQRPRPASGARAAAPRRELLCVAALAGALAVTPGCDPLDTRRALPERGSVGEEIYGVLCDRVGAQALREDLSGESFRDVCHRPFGGEYADTVDATKLPPIHPGAVDERGERVSVEKQRADREAAIGRIEALARRRHDLVGALDAIFPDTERIGIKDLESPDPKASCDAPDKVGEALLVEELADMLGRMGDLYNDGTIPHATGSLARAVAAFEQDEAAQAAWARLGNRRGYRPTDTALGPLRPVLSYPRLREFSNATLRLLSADSQPYELHPLRDDDGARIPVAGPANNALNKLLEVAHADLLEPIVETTTPAQLEIATDASGRVVLSRPRTNLEILSDIFLAEDDAFRVSSPRFIVRRDARGYAELRGGAVPAPFLDADGDGLPDLDEAGRFETADGSVPPSPFPHPGAPAGSRDEHGRPTTKGGLLYEYVDTSRTFTAQLTKDMRALVSTSGEPEREALMNVFGALPVMMGPRETRRTRYGDTHVEYDGVRPETSPMLDLVYAIGALLGDRSTDAVLAATGELLTSNPSAVARLTAALKETLDIAKEHPEATIPSTATFWDEMLETLAKAAKVPGLLEDVLRGLAAPETQQMGLVFSRLAQFKDEVTYDRDNLNGIPYNLTTKSHGELKTPVDRGAAPTGKNRSALYRFLQLVSDVNGVTACNKPDAKLHVSGLPDIPFLTFGECEAFKIENLGVFYLDTIANAYETGPDHGDGRPRPGTIHMRVNALNAVSSGSLIESSSGITGMWPTDGGFLGFGQAIAPQPKWVNRLVFFDHEGDRKNETTRIFIRDLSGEKIGTSVCPERIIDDPVPNAKDASPDGKVRGLRNCPEGQWLQQRGKNTIFTLEHFGFYESIRPLVTAFVKHGREDLFLDLAVAAYKHYPGEEASADECRLQDNEPCPRSGANTYEPFFVEAFASDLIPALGSIAQALDALSIKRCTALGRGADRCAPEAVEIVSGIEVAAAATRAAVDPDHAQRIGLTDRHGERSTTRNDGTPVLQVTPAYLLTNALSAIDLAFDRYEEQNPHDTERRANWRRARSQLVDQLLATTGIRSNTTFANPTLPKMGPALIEMLRSQLWAHCPRSFVPPYEECAWAREELTEKAEQTLGGPLTTPIIDILDAVRRDPEGRQEAQRLLAYLLDPASRNDALASVLASGTDLIQALRDDDNLVPLYGVLAEAMDGSTYDERGKLVDKSLVDAQMALLARLSGKYVDEDGDQICRNEIDPNGVLPVILKKLVTPLRSAPFDGRTPLHLLVDVIADVNRDDPSERYDGTLGQRDSAAVSTKIYEFLSDPESGLEQLYAVIRQGTKF